MAGIYGMNFERIPELGWLFGYPFALALMLLVAVVLHRIFKRSGWRLASEADHPIHDDLLGSTALERAFEGNGTYLLPLSYAEGAPAHSAYPSGHATTIGANVTALKAIFDEDFVVLNPVVPNAEGTELTPYEGEDLTVGGELDKLASNIAFGRNVAGVHYRSAAAAGLRLGEALVVGVLRDLKATYQGSGFGGFFFTNFDGERIEI